MNERTATPPAAAGPTRGRRMATPPAPTPATADPGVDPTTIDRETGEILPDRQTKALVFLQDARELEAAQDALLEVQLAGQEAVATLLYAYPEMERGQPTGRYVIGPSADFVFQMVRSLNRASKGKLNLQVMGTPPIVQDFTVPDSQGRPRPWVRVIAGVIDLVNGEPSWGIKTAPRVGTDPEGNAHTKALRRAFELHPFYNRKRITAFIRRKIRDLGEDPKKFLIVGEGAGGGIWSEFFGRARAAGLPAGDLRKSVRDTTGKGLSEVTTTEDAGAAAAAADAAIRDAGLAQGAASKPGAPDPGVEGARQPLSPTPPAPVDRRTQLLEECQEIITNTGLKDASRRIWAKVGSPKATVEDFERMKKALELVSTGTPEADAIEQVNAASPF